MTRSDDSKVSPMHEKSSYLNDGTIKCDDVAKKQMLIEERNRVIESYRNSKFVKRRML